MQPWTPPICSGGLCTCHPFLKLLVDCQYQNPHHNTGGQACMRLEEKSGNNWLPSQLRGKYFQELFAQVETSKKWKDCFAHHSVCCSSPFRGTGTDLRAMEVSAVRETCTVWCRVTLGWMNGILSLWRTEGTLRARANVTNRAWGKEIWVYLETKHSLCMKFGQKFGPL